MNDFSDEALILEFVTESREHLCAIEPDLLILEREGDATDAEIINRIFRAIHSIKGAAGFFGFEPVKRLSHVMENLLMSIRDGKIQPQPDIIQPLLMGADKLTAMMADVQTCEAVPFEEEAARLEAILEGRSWQDITVEPGLAIPSDAETMMRAMTLPVGFQPDPVRVRQCKANGRKLYSLQLSLDADLTQKDRSLEAFYNQLLAVGEVLEVVWDYNSFTGLSDCLNQALFFNVLYATVLEPELILIAADITDDQLRAFLPAEPESAPNLQILTTHLEPSAIASAKPEVVIPQRDSMPEKPVTRAITAINGAEGGDTIRVKVELLNKLMDLAGEMVLSRNQLLRAVGRHTEDNQNLDGIVQGIDLITSDLQEHIMQTRMQPIAGVFGRFPRVVRDMARQLGKEIELKQRGDDVELDKTIIESLSDPLTHLIRNCCDHAIETPDAREAVGKSRVGTVQLRAFHEDGQINIAVSDDGHGIDPERVARKALDKGLITEADASRMSSQEKVNLIFLPGFSTAETISDVSGRGVGMDVVKTNITKLGGHIRVDTHLGKGTTFLLRLPLTLAIIPSLIVGIANQRFAMPQISLVELVRIEAKDMATRIERVGSADILRLRGKLLPLVWLSRILELTNPAETSVRECNVMVLKVGAHQFGLVVDELQDTEEIVVKPLSAYLKSCKCFAGSAILGDGRVAMILDPGGLVNYAQVTFDAAEAALNTEECQISLGMGRQNVLLFNHGANDMFALPLNDILRLEQIDVAAIERLGRQEFLTFHGKGMPLLRLDHFLDVGPLPANQEKSYLIVPKAANGIAGILASQIVDTLETDTVLDPATADNNGIQGSAVIDGRLVRFIEPDRLLQRAGLLTPTSGASRA